MITKQRLAEARKLWEMLGDISVDENDYIDIPFLHFKSGIHREDIWHWFEITYDIPVAALMYPKEFPDGALLTPEKEEEYYFVIRPRQEIFKTSKQEGYEIRFTSFYSIVAIREDLHLNSKERQRIAFELNENLKCEGASLYPINDHFGYDQSILEHMKGYALNLYVQTWG